MIITRTPFRVSFFGGGTDYPSWYREHGGAVLSMTIDKYCWITCRDLPPFFAHRSRAAYSVVESVGDNTEFEHPSIRECLRLAEVAEGIEIHYASDLPARTGLGSSSSFTVGLLRALYELKGRTVSAEQLAGDAIHVEQEMIKETVGCQDQIAAAVGGLNHITIERDGSFRVVPVSLSDERLRLLEDCLLLVYTGVSRYASEIAAEQVKRMPKHESELQAMQDFVDEALKLLGGEAPLEPFGELMHENWLLKRQLSPRIATSDIDAMYAAARDAGALGGKVLGAGGGGFMLFFVLPQRREAVQAALAGHLEIPFRSDRQGCKVIFRAPDVEIVEPRHGP